MGLWLWKYRAKLPEIPEFLANFRRFTQKTNSGPPYPQKPVLPPLTVPLRLLRVCNRRAIHSSRLARRMDAAAENVLEQSPNQPE